MQSKGNSNKVKKDKVSFFRIVENNIYILKYAFRLDPLLVVMVILAHLLVSLSWSYASSLYLKTVIDCFNNSSINFSEAIFVIIRGGLILVIGDLIERGLDFFFYPRFTYMAGKIQESMFEKATTIDLICYDHVEFYDDFVIAAKQSEEMIQKGVLMTANLAGMLAAIFFLGGFILTVNPVIIVFPTVGFVINTVVVTRLTTLIYEYDIESKKIMRKADYSKRVFYQPEYAKEIKLSHIEVPLKRQFDEAVDEVVEEAKKKGRKIAILNLVDWITVYALLCDCFPPIYLGYLALQKRTISLAKVASLSSAQEEFRNGLNALNYSFVEFQRVGQYGDKFRHFMDYKIHTENQPGEELVAMEPAEIKIENMSFRYEGSKKDTLHHINMTIKPGQKIAIVGENGAGKTTFIKLLMRLYDVTEGAIRYGGENIQKYSTKSYRDIFGAVFQDFQLYAASLGENVLMGKCVEQKKENIEQALMKADFGHKLEKLEHGIETEMTREFHDDGTMLSGGEAQKVAIARLFAKKKKMMVAILDEPSSALDPKAEFILNKNMMEKSVDSTVIFISHRLSTTRNADCIYLFEHGEIVESGTHDELMELHGGYAKMFEKQAHYYQ